MIRYKIIQLDAGTEKYLPFAKREVVKKLATMTSINKDFNRTWIVDGVTIRARSIGFASASSIVSENSNFNEDDQLVKLWLSKSSVVTYNTLYDWPMSTRLSDFTLTYPNNLSNISGVALTPLAPFLSFSIDAPQDNHLSAAKFSMLCRRQNWMLRRYFSALAGSIFVDRRSGDPGELVSPPGQPAPLNLAQYNALTDDGKERYLQSVAYWRVGLKINSDDCFMSVPVITPAVAATPTKKAVPEKIECYFLFGQFQSPNKSQGVPYSALELGSPTGDDIKQYFRGVIISYSSLVAMQATPFNGSVDFSIYNPNSKAPVKILLPTDYVRSQPGVRRSLAFSTQYPISAVQFAYVESPFNATYWRQEQWTYTYNVIYQDMSVFNTTGARKEFLEQHTLDSSGQIHITPVDTSPLEGAKTITTGSTSNLDQSGSASSVNCKLAFYSGDALIPVADYALTAASYAVVGGIGTSTPGTVTITSALPFVAAPITPAMYADEYLPEYGLIRSGAAVLNTDFSSRVYSRSYPYDIGSGVQFYQTEAYRGSISNSSTNRTGVFVRTDTTTGFVYGLTGYDGFNVPTEFRAAKTGVPQNYVYGQSTPQTVVGGIYWHRDGPTGVFTFSVPYLQFKKRADDCLRYQRVYDKFNADYLPSVFDKVSGITTPAGKFYEPLPVILARIVANTTVLINNFASTDLYPWVAPNFHGVII